MGSFRNLAAKEGFEVETEIKRRGRRGEVALRMVRSVLPDRWVMGMAGGVTVVAGLDAALWGVLSAADSIRYGVGAPATVIAVRAVTVLIGANRGLRVMLANGVGVVTCANYSMMFLRTAGFMTEATFLILYVSLFNAGVAALLLGIDGDEVKGLRTGARSVRERFNERPTLRILLVAAVAATFLPLIGMISGGVMVSRIIGVVLFVGGITLFSIRDLASGGDGHWP